MLIISQEQFELFISSYKKIHCMKNNPFTLAAIRKTISRFENTRSIHNMPKSGRSSLVSQRAPMVSEQLGHFKRSNSKMIATASQISRKIDRKIFLLHV